VSTYIRLHMPATPSEPPPLPGSAPPSPPPRWAIGPRRPRLGERELHVWLVDLEQAGEDRRRLLSEGELARGRAMASEGDRRRWTRARGALRALLGRYLGRDARAIELVAGPHGKPALAGAGERRLAFNLSHSGRLALVALARADVGVDVETVRRPIDEIALAARTFGPATAARLRALQRPARTQAFLREWTRHEAALKCLGGGLARAASERERSALWIAELDLGELAAGAVALEREPSELRLWLLSAPAGADGSEGT
jgi:4'-phosphopantetheinyl transferase